MRVLIAPDKFKGSLSAQDVAATIARAIHSVDPRIEVDQFPIADGGEGTAAILAEHLAATRRLTQTVDAIGRPIEAESFIGNGVAIVDMSAASGLWRINCSELDPMRATTFGTGIQIRQLREAKVPRILLGLGGSATNDAGLGMAAAVGYRFFTSKREPVIPGPSGIRDIAVIEPPENPDFPECIGLSDVETKLTGPNGATHTFGPQKGLTPSMVAQLDLDFMELVARIEKQLGTNFADVPRSGAAGGLGYGIMTFLGGKLVSGFEYLADSAKLREHVIAADLVVTGEGKLDHQTLQGKGPFGVAALARACGKPVYAVAGSIEASERLAPFFAKTASLVNERTSLVEALRDPEGILYQRARALFEIVAA
ncbi:MAG TPA: glycerate kinase [Chthoniobacterales bacterium]|nr:glycerate kinase [Chthoniobacterales bacterium]